VAAWRHDCDGNVTANVSRVVLAVKCKMKINRSYLVFSFEADVHSLHGWFRREQHNAEKDLGSMQRSTSKDEPQLGYGSQ
jgi:hypothetical protein